MQIGSGHSALSLSLLKALGAQSGAQGGAQNATTSGAAATPADPRAATTAAARTETSQAATKTSPQASRPGASAGMQAAAAVDGGPLPPRGSFVDLRA